MTVKIFSPSRRTILLMIGVALLSAFGAAVAVHFVRLEKAKAEEREADLGAERQRREEISLVRGELRKMSTLDEGERAQGIWRLWLRIKRERWDYTHEHEEALMSELVELDGPAFDVLVASIHEALDHDAYEAARKLRMFGPKATFTLIEILRTGTEDEQDVALTGLWYCTVSLGITDSERKAIREAVLPFASGSEKWQREGAQIILEDLRD